MNKKDITKWITENLPTGFNVKQNFELVLDGENKIFLNADLYIKDKEFEDNGYLLIFSDNIIPTSREIAYLFSICKLSKIKKGIFIHVRDKIEEIYLSLDNISIRNIKFSTDLNIKNGGEEFLDELFDE